MGIDSNPLARIRAIAIQCRHCSEPVCTQACISGGIFKDENGSVILNPEKCIACWSCIMVCPFGVISKNDEQHRAFKCDHCPERSTPACVDVCPVEALLYIEQEEIELIYFDE
jgi:carbon-monoxide dehydrogenase iron sulfur subunit